MLQWMQTVVNFIGFDNETVEISMSYLDRFLETQDGREAIACRTTYQLASMTALYIAVKIHCAEALTPQLLAELSQGAYNDEQFEEMERIMLQAIQWRVNPPTGTCFVQETLDILPPCLFQTEEIRQTVLDLSKSQAEWAVGDYDLLSVRRSVVAFAAIHNALKHQKVRFNVYKFLQDNVKGQSIGMDCRQAVLIQKKLREAIPFEDESISYSSRTNDVVEDEERNTKAFDDNNDLKSDSAGKSPRSVAYRNVAA